VMQSANEAIGSDLTIAPIDVTVKALSTTVQGPFSFASSAKGSPMQERVGRGSVATIVAADPELWVLGGVKYPDGDPLGVGLIDSNPVSASGKAYRYRRADGWSSPVALPASFPLYGAATAASGSKIYSFGGFVNQAPSNTGFVLETAGTPSVTAGTIKLPPNTDGETTLTLAGAVAASMGDHIYVAGGLAHADAPLNPDGTPGAGGDTGLAVTLSFNPATSSWDSNQLPGPSGPYKSMAGAVVGQKWYCFGGFRSDREPLGDVQIFDATTQTWSKGSHAMPTPRYGCATAVVDGKIWVIGGEIVRGEASRAVEVYDPSGDSWTRRAPLRFPSSYAGAAAFGTGAAARIVVGAGVSGASPQGLPLPLVKDRVEELTP
jgi:hypothetical protein